MRSTLFSMSMTMALFAGLPVAQAGEVDPFLAEEPISRVQYSVPGNFSAPDEPGVVDLSESGFDDMSQAWDQQVVPQEHWFDLPKYGMYFQGDALWLARIHSVDRPLVVTLPPGSQTVLTAQDAPLTDFYRPGMMLTLGYRIDQVSAFEFTYFGLNEWNSSATAASPAGNLGLAGTLQTTTQDFIFADRITFEYGSSIQNAEANYKQTIEGLTLLTGFRYFSLTEAVNINSHSALFNEASDYHVTAFNRLVGWQFGAGYGRQWGRLNVGILGKIGVFANLASQTTLLRDFGNTFTDRDYRAETTPVSVLGEAIFNASYQVFDWLLIRGGYRFIGVDNVALGPDQLDLNAPALNRRQSVQAHEYLLLHGFNAGFEIRW
ncbi:MAG: hypothetical protein ACM3U2_17585 [Deltaproteobacteria bacterium]